MRCRSAAQPGQECNRRVGSLRRKPGSVENRLNRTPADFIMKLMNRFRWARPLAVVALTVCLTPLSQAQLTPEGTQFFEQDQDDLPGGAERGNSFGSDVEAGDFNNDGLKDIAVGLPGEDGGSVIVIYHYCPVKSRIESAGWGHRVSFRGSRTAARPVKWAFSRKG